MCWWSKAEAAKAAQQPWPASCVGSTGRCEGFVGAFKQKLGHGEQRAGQPCLSSSLCRPLGTPRCHRLRRGWAGCRALARVAACTSDPPLSSPSPLSSEQLANCTALACQHHCVPTLSGPACYCNNSFQLAEDRRSCKGGCRCRAPGAVVAVSAAGGLAKWPKGSGVGRGVQQSLICRGQ